jgi:hypothetical protein
MKYILFLVSFSYLFNLRGQVPEFKKKLEKSDIAKIEIYILPFQLVRTQPISPKEFIKFYDVKLEDNWSFNNDYTKLKNALLELKPVERRFFGDVRLMCMIYLKSKGKIKLFITRHGSIQIDEAIYKADENHTLLKELLFYFSDYYRPAWLKNE